MSNRGIDRELSEQPKDGPTFKTGNLPMTEYVATCPHCKKDYPKTFKHVCPLAEHPGGGPQPVKGPLELFDLQFASINASRSSYGHPAINFQRIARLCEGLPEFKDPRFKLIATMILTKLSRLAETPDHLDSLLDIAGYARAWVMILDAEDKHK